MHGVTFLALGKFARVGLPPVRLTWQLEPRMDYMLLSTPATDRLILLILAFWFCTGLHHCKRTTIFLKYPKY
eukprot:2367112-Pleurochrysis_carterae.AAC.2